MPTKINLFDTGTQANAVQLSPSKLTNLYPVTSFGVGNPKAKALYKTPGTSLFSTMPNELKIRGMLEFKNVLYTVCGNKLFAVGTSGAITSLGTLNSFSGRVSIINNGTQLLLDDGINGYVLTINTGVLTTISDPDYTPSGFVTYQGFRAIFAVPSSSEFRISDLNDFTSYDPLNFANAESIPQNLVCAFATQSDLYLFGEKKSEIWYNSGDANFPYTKNQNANIPYGCAARFSIVEINNSIIFLSRNDQGRALLITLNGYVPQILTDENGVNELANLQTIDDAYAFSFQQNGHIFYALIFPTENKSYLYDVTTQAFIHWSSWSQSGLTSSGAPIYELGRHLADGYAYFNNKHIIADYRGNGNLLELSSDIFTDYDAGSDDSIYCELITPVISLNRDRIYIDSMEIDLEKGVTISSELDSSDEAPLLSISLSKDSGRLFDYTRIVNYGFTGEYRKRVKLNKWGYFRDGSIKLFTNHSSFVAIFDLIINLRLENPASTMTK
jgi:hypothetical protein